MGEGGQPYDLVMYRLRWWQLLAIYRGINRRQRVNYESAQWLSHAIGSMFTSNAPTFPGYGEPWPWSDDTEDALNEEEEEAERLALLEEIRKENAEIERNKQSNI